MKINTIQTVAETVLPLAIFSDSSYQFSREVKLKVAFNPSYVPGRNKNMKNNVFIHIYIYIFFCLLTKYCSWGFSKNRALPSTFYATSILHKTFVERKVLCTCHAKTWKPVNTRPLLISVSFFVYLFLPFFHSFFLFVLFVVLFFLMCCFYFRFVLWFFLYFVRCFFIVCFLALGPLFFSSFFMLCSFVSVFLNAFLSFCLFLLFVS